MPQERKSPRAQTARARDLSTRPLRDLIHCWLQFLGLILFLWLTHINQVNKALGTEVDCICLDFEDSVAVSRKADARASAVKLLSTLDFGKKDAAVRINALDTGKLPLYCSEHSGETIV